MKKPKISLKELLITSGFLATISGVILTYSLSRSSEKMNQKKNNSVNFTGDTDIEHNNISGGPMTVYSNSKNNESFKVNSAPTTNSMIIKNSNIAENIVIESNDIAKLIEFYQFQANEINSSFKNFYRFVPVKTYLDEFNNLHKKHIEALENNNLILAAKYVSKIHRLSLLIEIDEEDLKKEEKRRIADSLGQMIEEVQYLYGEFPKGILGGRLANKYLIGQFKEETQISTDYDLRPNLPYKLDTTELRLNAEKFYRESILKNLNVD